MAPIVIQFEVDFSVVTLAQAKSDAITIFHREIAKALLIETKGSVTRSAKILDIDRSNFLRLLRRLGLKSADFIGQSCEPVSSL